MVNVVSPAELKRLLDIQEAILIDVREPNENAEESIEGAHLLPLKEVDVDKLPAKDKIIVFHCRSGGRSFKACEKVLSQNPSLKVFNLEGGITAWRNAGFAVKQPEKKSISIERQRDIIVGTLVLIGVLLGHFVSPLFYFLSGLIGLGLIASGIAGFCGMSQLLTKMPWNQP